MIPISTVRLGPDVEERVLAVLRSGSIAQGPVVAELESRFADLAGVRHAVAVNNGTTALVVAIESMQLQPGDEVITSPFTFVATVNAILEAGATVTFADINDDDFALDAGSVSSAVSDRTRVLAPVHLYGQTADMDPLLEIVDLHGLRLLEDAAQSHGARYRGRPIGERDLATYSFYATKNITTGEGGIVTTNDDGVADRLRILRNQGMRARYVYELAGHNYRLTDLQASIAIPQIDRYAETVQVRRRNAARLTEGLQAAPGIVPPATFTERDHVWHQYTVRVTEESAVTREALSERLAEAGVGSGIYYPKLIGDYAAYADHPRVVRRDTPVARRVASQVLSLPVHTALTDDDLDVIIEQVVRIASGR